MRKWLQGRPHVLSLLLDTCVQGPGNMRLHFNMIVDPEPYRDTAVQCDDPASYEILVQNHIRYADMRGTHL